jgi:hypothetical protein
MMKIKMFILIFLIVNALGAPTLVKAETEVNDYEDISQEFFHKFFREFSNALHERNLSKLKSLMEPSVEIPEIRENTPISGIQSLPSPQKNSLILIGSFRDDLNDCEGSCPERIAFIWEVSIKKNKISNIKVISDVANPHMNELIVTKEYREKFNKEILVPMHFPFKMTHVNGKVSGEKIFLQYENKEIAGVLEIRAEPSTGEVKLPKRTIYKQVDLKKSYKGLIGEKPTGFELIFLSNNMQYTVRLLGYDKKYNPSKKELIKVVNWMLYTIEPRGMYYEDNSGKVFKDADAFYRSLDKKKYAEFKNAKMNVREKTNFENVNNVFARVVDGDVRISDADIHPKRQVYVFISISQEGKKVFAVFDAETGDQI